MTTPTPPRATTADTQGAGRERSSTAMVWRYGALSAALAAGYGVLFTVVGDFRDEYGISETSIGVLIGTGFLSAFVAQLTIAPLADRGHARRLVVAGVIVNVVGLVLMAVGTSLLPLLVGRIISGLGIGAALPAIRRIVVVSDPDHLGRNLGRLLSADVFGFATGPAISAVLVGPFGLAAPFLVVAALTTLLLLTNARTPVPETTETSPTSRRSIDLLGRREVAGAVALGAGAFLMIGGFDALWDVVHEDLDTPDWMANLGITLFALPLIILGPIGGSLAQRVGPYRISALGLFAGAAFMFIYGSVPTGTWIFGFSMIHAVTDGLTIAAAGVAIGMVVSDDRQAAAQGLMGAAQALVAGVTAIVVGGVYDASGRFAGYATTGTGIVLITIAGLVLAAPEWRQRGPLLRPRAPSSPN